MSAPQIAVDTTTTPPTVTVTFAFDGTKALAAQATAIDTATKHNTIVANGAALTIPPTVPVLKDPAKAGRVAFIQALVPMFRNHVEAIGKSATMSAADITAQQAAARATADADAAALSGATPMITVK